MLRPARSSARARRASWTPRSALDVAREPTRGDAARVLGFCFELGERRHALVPFDDRGHAAEARERAFVQSPDIARDPRAMIVEQKPSAIAMPSEVDLLDAPGRDPVEIRLR